MRVLSKSVNSLIVCDIVGGISIVGFLAFYYRLNIFVSILAVALFVLCNHFILSAKGYYQIRPYKFRGIGSYLLLEGVVLAALPVLFVLFFLIHPPVLLLKLIASEIVLFYVFVIALRSSFNLFRAYIKPDKRVLILGTGITAQMVAKEIIERPLLKFKLIGFLENDSEKRDFEFRGIKVLGTSSDAIKIVKQNKIDIVITSQVGMFDYQTQYDISECVPLKISFWKMYEFYEEITGKIPVEAISPAWFMFNFGTAHRPFYKFFKRAIDIIAGILILLINSPVLLLVAAWIKIYDRGPVIFKQVRVGFNGRPFEIYKMRTMCINDYKPKDSQNFENTNQNTDSRVIPGCRWVRKMRFDELPQVINIIKGDMSLVGPRPEWSDYVKIYNDEVRYYARRHWVPVGLAGWQQIHNGHVVGVESTTERVSYDLYYIKHRNIFWEMAILLKTIGLAITKRAK